VKLFGSSDIYLVEIVESVLEGFPVQSTRLDELLRPRFVIQKERNRFY